MRLALGIALVFGRMLSFTPFAPSATQAASAERVQVACDYLRAHFLPDELKTGVAVALEAYKETGAPTGIPAIVDMRIYELFCSK